MSKYKHKKICPDLQIFNSVFNILPTGVHIQQALFVRHLRHHCLCSTADYYIIVLYCFRLCEYH